MLGDVLPLIEAAVEGEEYGPRAEEGGAGDDGAIRDRYHVLEGTPAQHGAIEQTHGGDREHAGDPKGKEHEENLRGQPAEEGESRLEQRDSRH